MAITREEYRALRSTVPQQRHFAITFLILLLDLVLFVSGLALVSRGGWAPFAAGQLLFVIVFFHGFAILHECGHGTAAESRFLNTVAGHYASLFCFMPYFPWKYIHAEHHTWAGNIDRDPTMKLIREFRESAVLRNAVVRATWKYWIPLLGLLQHFVLWGYPLKLLRRESRDRERLVRCLISVLLLPAVYLSLHALFPVTFNLQSFAPCARDVPRGGRTD